MEPLTDRARALADRVRRADPTVSFEAESTGEEAAPALAPLTASPDWHVRESLALALEGIATSLARRKATDDLVEDTLVALTADEKPVVRRTALRALTHVATARSTPALLAIATTATDPHERFDAIRPLGTRALLSLEDMRAHHDREPHHHAARGWLLARAGRGDRTAQAAYNKLLADDRTRDVAPHLRDHLPHLEGLWLVPGLFTWLGEPFDALFRGHGATPESLRLCDCAVIALATRAGLTLPFPVGPRHFTGAELEQAREAARPFLDTP